MMADVEVLNEAAAQATTEEAITEAVVNATEATKTPASPEGMALAYGSLLIMALLPIFFGSFRSVQSHKENRETSARTGEKPETMTQKDAAMFPIIASCALFGLYLFFQLFSKEHINLLLSVYFFALGIFALTHMVAPVVTKYIPANLIPLQHFNLRLTEGSPDKSDKTDVFCWDFSTHDLVILAVSTVFGIWYFMKKHWIANNLFGLAFAINGVELLHLNDVMTGCILLGGLFFYDIFWVFGTNVMVTVAKSFEAPIKLVFPQDLLENGLDAKNMAMLGLGDIVIPGIFVALLLRYDRSLNRNSHFYFYATFLAYIAGLAFTIFIMHWYKHAQPALLYLVPACLGTPMFLALVRGDLKSMLKYADHPEEEKDDQKEEEKKKDSRKKEK
jgi:minor histocompatibility antigen H13